MGNDQVRVIERARQTAEAVDMLLRGYRTQTVCNELRLSRDRVAGIRSALIAEGYDLPSNVRGVEITVPTIMSKADGVIESTMFCHELMSYFNLLYPGHRILTKRATVSDVNYAYTSYMRIMDRVNGSLTTRLRITDCWVLARDLSMNLIYFYSCRKCGCHRVVHEDQKISTRCPFC